MCALQNAGNAEEALSCFNRALGENCEYASAIDGAKRAHNVLNNVPDSDEENAEEEEDAGEEDQEES